MLCLETIKFRQKISSVLFYGSRKELLPFPHLLLLLPYLLIELMHCLYGEPIGLCQVLDALHAASHTADHAHIKIGGLYGLPLLLQRRLLSEQFALFALQGLYCPHRGQGGSLTALLFLLECFGTVLTDLGPDCHQSLLYILDLS